jgi:cytochrome c oxidase subunit IV
MTTHSATHEHDSHKPLYLKIFVLLMVLLVVTVGAAWVPLPGSTNLIVAMAIAVIKAALILMFFMHFRDSDHLTWLVGSATLVWFGILIALTFNDYWSRGWFHGMPGK